MFEKISRFRTELMGFAIIWVILFHSEISIPILGNLYRIGYGGVDIFFFLSGLGLFFSFSKNQDVTLFYRKRFTRIFPTYIIIVLFSMLFLGPFRLTQFLVNVSTIGYWINKSYFEWYIPSLVLFYVTFPLLFKLINRSIGLFFSVILFVTVSLMVMKLQFHLNEKLILFITRIPIFSIGILWGKWTVEKKQFSKLSTRLIIILSLLGLIGTVLSNKYVPRPILLNYGLFWYPFIVITPGLCALISYTLDKLKLPFINKALAFFGTISLELYLLHVKLFEESGVIAEYFNMSRPLILLIIMLLIIPCSVFISKLITFLHKTINNVEMPVRRHGALRG